jgi:GNAT superfamily N-acetyltransferase
MARLPRALESRDTPIAMSGPTTTSPGDGFLSAVEVGLTTIDDMSSIRHLHASSARRLAAGMLSEAEITAFAEHIYAEIYSTRMAEVVRAGRMTAARFAGQLIGTAGWTPANDAGAVARMVGVFVSPLHAGCGVARLLLDVAETQARQAGFRVFTVRAPLGASGFFERLGYEVASHGVWPLTREIQLPVAFLRKADPVAPPRRI